MKRIYSILMALFVGSALFAANSSPIEGLTEIFNGFTSDTDDQHTIHLYTATGKLTRGYNEVFIAVTDLQGHFVDDFLFSFTPLMDMGSMKHSTPVGKIEKVDGKPLYKTWFSFLMAGAWTLDISYSIGIASAIYFIKDIPLTVDAYTGGNKWLQSVSIGGETHYLTLASPTSLTVGTQSIWAYLNKPGADTTKPYGLVDGSAYKIAIAPQMPEMGHGSSGNTDLIWNAKQEFFEGTINLSMAGDWKIGLKVLDAVNDAILADNNYFWQVEGVHKPTTGLFKPEIATVIRVYPTVTDGEITVEVPVDAQVEVVSTSGQRLQSRTAIGNAPLTLHLTGKGFYLIGIKTIHGEVITRKIVVR